MLVRNGQGNPEEVTPAGQGGESALAAEARVLVQEVNRIRNEADCHDCMILADAILHLSAIVYGADPPWSSPIHVGEI